MAEAKKLVIIDGNSVFYRGYYATPNLSTKDGKPTGGVFGFALLGLQILKKFEPEYVIVAWDKYKTNARARKKIYPLYKAGRKPMPEDLREQIPLLREMFEAFGWPLVEVDDFEADDIMATLSRQAQKKGLKTTLVTSDLDILQAVYDGIEVCTLKKGLTNIVQYSPQSFKEEYGMSVDQFIDYKALKGDSSDNVPGVAGVGDKTARDLIQTYGNLDGVYKNLSKIKDTVRAKLEKDKEMAFLSHRLLEIRFDAPVRLDLKAAAIDDADPKVIAELFNQLEFRRLLNELPPSLRESDEAIERAQQTQAKKSQAMAVAVERIETKADLQKLLKKKLKQLLLFSLFNPSPFAEKGEKGEGVEHTNLPELRGIMLSLDGKTAVIIEPSQKLALKDAIAALKPLLEDPKLPKIGFDVKNDIKAWLAAGVEIQNVGFDVMVGSLLLNPLLRSANLEQLALDELKLTVPAIDRTAPLEEVSAGLIMAGLTQLHSLYQQRLDKLPKLAKVATDIEWPVALVLARVEYFGVKLDTAYLKKMSKRFGERIEQVKKAIYKEAKEEFNISSPVQLSKVLFETLKLPLQGVKKTKTGISTAASELDKLRGLHPIINLISEYRELAKLKSTYVDPLPQLVDSKSRLHTTFNQIGSQTGRLSSDHPNLMNIPVRTEVGREIRRAFVADPGNVLISADYSQFELRLSAYLSGDKNMIHAFNKGIDIHAMTAGEMYDLDAKDVNKDQRASAKTVNFGVLYGMSPHGLSVATGMPHEQAQEFIDRYFEVRKPLLKYLESLKQMAKKEGYVETLFGRRRPMPDIKSSNFMVRNAAERAAINMPAQGTEADLMKLAMIEIDKKLDTDSHMLLQVHDSILVEAPRAKAKKVAKLLKDTMENIHKLPVKLDVDVSIGSNWGEL